MPAIEHIAALIGRFRESLAQRRPEADMIIGDDDLAARTARVEPQPARFPRNYRNIGAPLHS